MTDRFRPGDPIAWRNCVRLPGRPGMHPSFASAMTVVRDEPDEIALYRGPGYRMQRRRAVQADTPSTFRHRPVARLLDIWDDDPPWTSWRVLVLKRPESEHAISLFWPEAGDELAFWYIDLIGPIRRRPFGFDYPEHGLDVVVEPDLTRWKWKDEDELEWAVERGVYARSEADRLYAEGRRAVDGLLGERDRYERWLTWRPDPSWQPPTLPRGWDEVAPDAG